MRYMKQRKTTANKGLLSEGQRGFRLVQFFYLPLLYSDWKLLPRLTDVSWAGIRPAE